MNLKRVETERAETAEVQVDQLDPFSCQCLENISWAHVIREPIPLGADVRAAVQAKASPPWCYKWPFSVPKASRQADLMCSQHQGLFTL